MKTIKKNLEIQILRKRERKINQTIYSPYGE
jgi:hypothetical protein